MPCWREQYDRMKRWHARIENAAVADAQHVDNVHAFFICCFHLKDWLKADPSIDAVVRKRAEDLVNANVFLKLCADLANGSKHMVLGGFVRVAPGLVLASGPQVSTYSRKYGDSFPTLDTADGRVLFPAFLVAGKCVDVWDEFLGRYGMLAPGPGNG